MQADLCLLADIPAGVVNIITGKVDEAGAALAAHPGIDHVRPCITACWAASAAHARQIVVHRIVVQCQRDTAAAVYAAVTSCVTLNSGTATSLDGCLSAAAELHRVT
jgi:Aldehyde dehydrogenase family